MALQNRYTQSIRPNSLDDFNTIQDYKDMMDFFNSDSQEFIDSLDSLASFERHHNSVYAVIVNHQMYNQRLLYHKELRKNKLLTIKKYLSISYTQFQLEFYNITGRLTSSGYTPQNFDNPTSEQIGLLNDYFNLVYSFLGLIQGFINVLFFGFESSAKILAGLGCLEFSTTLSNNQKFTHTDVWNALRHLSHYVPFGVCQQCQLQNQCTFTLNFEAYANCYAYIIKTRMLSDYSALFYALANPLAGTLGDDLKILFKYFFNIETLISGQNRIENVCMGW